MNFLPDVEKILAELDTTKSINDQLDYIFTHIKGVSIKPASELTAREEFAFSKFFGLKTTKKVKSITFIRRTHNE